MMNEGIHYELISPMDGSEDAWDIRILENGDYYQTIVRFGTIRFDGENEMLTFDFDLVYTPNKDLTTEDTELQDYVGLILESVIDRALATDSLLTSDPDEQ